MYMDKAERTEKIQAKKQELVDTLEAHVAALESLETTTSFDFDVATDIHPELIDNTTVQGRARLKFWQDLYQGLENAPKYTIVKRYDIDLKPGCYGFGKEAEYQITQAWVRIYKDLSPSALVFKRDRETGKAEIFIDAPSHLLTGNGHFNRLNEDVATPTLLLSEHSPSFNVGLIPPEHTHDPEVLFMQDTVELLLNGSDVLDSSMRGESLPIDWHEYTRQEKLADPRFK